MTTGRLVEAKELIKYNNKGFEENDEEEKKPIHIELTEQKAGLMMKMQLTLDDQMYKEKMKKSLIRLTWSRDYKSKLVNILKVTEGLLDYYIIVPKNKKKDLFKIIFKT